MPKPRRKSMDLPGETEATGAWRPPGPHGTADSTAPSSGDRLSEKDFARLAKIVGEHVGIQLPPSKRVMLEGRLRRRARTLGLASIAEYCRLISDDAYMESEFVHLIDAVTTNKTDFFREPQHFDCLRDVIVPSLLNIRSRGGEHGKLKLWSAACSIGAEAYSIAMLLSSMGQAVSGNGFALLGTDICTDVLEQARRAVYPEDMIRPVPPEMQRRYVMRARDGNRGAQCRIVPEVRRLCRFVRLNLMDETYPFDRDVDVIFLRNVLIYFDKPTQEAVVRRLIGHLRPGGYLLLGHSESMLGSALNLRQVAPSVFLHG